ncbi:MULTISPECIES: type III secretion system inner rod subunit SctI [unclassified Mycoavidus]|uniref:type III secretion system inner rod subunit SctI n=1 Tax=unclassified Mycoavidus TaxID=2649241 RepID=UPI001CC0B48D|nr:MULTISPECIES: type III secretion system inner rod subunit SctI [unclassified Mycoavidus]UAW64282.1 type III secretion system inner rod subunit SctI [Mycoavidus sp. HKI]UUM21707.1 type III secretion system inner rod subunit SctI [Mycoavidus sp. SF9855]
MSIDIQSIPPSMLAPAAHGLNPIVPQPSVEQAEGFAKLLQSNAIPKHEESLLKAMQTQSEQTAQRLAPALDKAADEPGAMLKVQHGLVKTVLELDLAARIAKAGADGINKLTSMS